jgi:hypothetical protein
MKLLLGCFLSLFTCAVLHAQENTVQENSNNSSIEKELDAFRENLYTAFNEGRYEEMLNLYCHPDVVATWQDGSVSHGHAEVLAEFKKLSGFIDKIHVDPTIEKRMILDGGKMVVSTGKMNDTYKLARGETVTLDSHWSGTIANVDGKWLLVSFHGVANSFDNPVIRLFVTESTNRMMLLSAAGGLLAGLLGGFLIGRKKG